jgi:hypothetical protein
MHGVEVVIPQHTVVKMVKLPHENKEMKLLKLLKNGMDFFNHKIAPPKLLAKEGWSVFKMNGQNPQCISLLL